MAFISTAQADLVARLGGQAVYDTDRNITWLANANANGPMTWDQANTWAANLNVDGITGWRLPTALNADGSGPCEGVNCTGSELGHLFYNELGGMANHSILTTHNANFNLFSNIQGWVYWSGTEYGPNLAWAFLTVLGRQGYCNKGYCDSGWAVHDGDVPAVPEPEEWAMMLVGSGLISWQLRRRAKAAA